MHKRKSITSVLKSCVEHEWAIFVIYLNLLYQVTTDAKSMMHTCLIIHRVHVKIENDYNIYVRKRQRITSQSISFFCSTPDFVCTEETWRQTCLY